jgi:anti-sigma regulatory factor (Ser/Thr protein kinase)
MVFAFVVNDGPDAPTRARHALRERLRHMLDASTARDLELLISEVVTNAVRYGTAGSADGRGHIDVRVEVDSEMINVHIVDPGPGFSRRTPIRPRFERDPGGFGLFLLDQLSSRWGVERDERGFRVWFRLDRAGRATPETPARPPL